MSCMAPWLITKGPGGPPWCALGCAPWGHTLVAHNAHFYDRFITRRPRPDNARPTGARFNFLLGSSSSRGWHPCISYQHCSCVLLCLPACKPITIIACFDTATVRNVNDWMRVDIIWLHTESQVNWSGCNEIAKGQAELPLGWDVTSIQQFVTHRLQLLIPLAVVYSQAL